MSDQAKRTKGQAIFHDVAHQRALGNVFEGVRVVPETVRSAYLLVHEHVVCLKTLNSRAPVHGHAKEADSIVDERSFLNVDRCFCDDLKVEESRCQSLKIESIRKELGRLPDGPWGSVVLARVGMFCSRNSYQNLFNKEWISCFYRNMKIFCRGFE